MDMQEKSFAAPAPAIPDGDYVVDVTRSELRFRARAFGLVWVRGRMPAVEGAVHVREGVFSGDGVRAAGAWTPVRDREDLSGAGWFPAVRLNYTDQVFARADPARAGLIVVRENADPVEVSWERLRDQVAALAAHLRRWGIRPGDRVGAYLPNVAEALIGLLASAAVGATWSCCAPDYGVDAVVDRLAQIAPRVLLVADGYDYGGRRVDRTGEVAAIVDQLPTVEHVVHVGTSRTPPGAHRWNDVTPGGTS